MRNHFGATNVRRGIVVLTMLTTMFGLIGIGAAQAAVTTHISAHYTASTTSFYGKLTSANAECLAHRTVRLFKKTAMGRKLEGMATSRTHGGWSIDLMHAHGKYVAVVRSQKLMGVSCGGATSSVVDVM